MIAIQDFKLSGTALPKDAIGMLDEIAEHFTEHSDVLRTGNHVLLKSDIGTADIRAEGDRLLIELNSPSDEALQLVRTMLAEHLFYFAGDDPFELNWSELPPPASPSNLYEMTVVSAEDVTPRMRRVKFSCADISPFMRDDMHVRLLVPPKGRPPVWPGIREDGRLAWPKGEDKIVVRIYTIRAVDVERRELWIDFLQHPAPGVHTPGADFARDAQPGQTVALIGPGGGDMPKASRILLVGDESALPAIARIAAEAEPGTRLQAIIEVEDEAEQQVLTTRGTLDVQWLHRANYPTGSTGMLADEAINAIAPLEADTFIWVACEKKDVRTIKGVLKTRNHDRKLKYVAWYWERGVAARD
ncbi:siderophore-interacting protein [Agrobacterium sp. a22-2]|uniref:DUF2218 domain-containing protein n=1 Tax=Agrobacterium sp. a22-2 TaxID=2283840 RepID=UPI0014459FC7|nr:DUF2218 domain-containing protein [Agrobacterium sp. a22-2]NKN35958.1 siderophore-interacting protein [Agrobacterium sp. a22-2]